MRAQVKSSLSLISQGPDAQISSENCSTLRQRARPLCSCISQSGAVDCLCYQTHVWLIATQEPIIWEASVSRKERCFHQKSRQSGKMVDSCPETNSEDSVQLRQFLKEKIGEESQWIIEAGVWILHHSPCMRTDWLSLQMFSCPRDLPAGFLRWLLGVEK